MWNLSRVIPNGPTYSSEYTSRMLSEGRLSGHPFKVFSNGLEDVGEGLRKLKAGEARGRKFVFRIGDEI